MTTHAHAPTLPHRQASITQHFSSGVAALHDYADIQLDHLAQLRALGIDMPALVQLQALLEPLAQLGGETLRHLNEGINALFGQGHHTKVTSIGMPNLAGAMHVQAAHYLFVLKDIIDHICRITEDVCTHSGTGYYSPSQEAAWARFNRDCKQTLALFATASQHFISIRKIQVLH